MKSTALILMIITVISKLLGFFRVSLLAKYFGAGTVADAYNLASQFPVVIFSFIAAGISTGFIPTYKRLEKKEGYLIADKFTSNLGNVSIIVSIALLIVCQLFAPQITRLMAMKMPEKTHLLATNFSRITIISILVLGVSTVYRGYLYAKDNYIIPAVQGFILNFFIIISIVIAAKTNVYLLPIGLCLGTIIQFVPYIPAVRKTKFKWSKKIDFKDKNLKNMLYLAIPVIFGVSINVIGVLIDKNLATYIMDVGGFTIMENASRLSEFINGIVTVSVATIAYTALSESSAKNNIDKFKDTILSSISSINILIYPALIGMMIFARPILTLAFERGEWERIHTIAATLPLQFYALGLAGVALRDILSKAFYSLNDTKTPTFNSLLIIVVDLIASLIAAYFLGLGGLALGTSIGAYAGSFLLLIKLRRKIGKFNNINTFVSENTKMIISSIIMGILSFLVYNFLMDITSSTVSLLISVVVAALVYFICLMVLKVDELRSILDSFKRKFSKK